MDTAAENQSPSSSDVDVTPRGASSAVLRALQLTNTTTTIPSFKPPRKSAVSQNSQRCRRSSQKLPSHSFSMLRADSPESHHESALLALLNLAVKDEDFAHSLSFCQQQADHRSSGAIPPLVHILKHGTTQAKVDAVMALSNLSTHSDNLTFIKQTSPIPAIVSLLKASKSLQKQPKMLFRDRILGDFEEGRTALAGETEASSGRGARKRHSPGKGTCGWGTADDMRERPIKYREPILRRCNPGSTGANSARNTKISDKSKDPLRLLRESPYPRSELEPDTLENIVCNIISQINGDEQSSKAKKMLAEMVQVMGRA
ncbi:hypothetical protein F3Y22_tig00110356pilonHSYRG00039 [Hibiscus syriacus]|uniref:Uncharacterized protein n=1 Tax=Hibiscus syriacus TaxID=106335 RepID=A0A6A3AYB3_HIBSY|nr:hypothetical protein F3Y22_tig00110356pilonHSYRG00039 [Hibiscus syriacus]